jgi:hypothetical protein
VVGAPADGGAPRRHPDHATGRLSHRREAPSTADGGRQPRWRRSPRHGTPDTVAGRVLGRFAASMTPNTQAMVGALSP